MRSATAGRPAARLCLNRSYLRWRAAVLLPNQRQEAFVILPTRRTALEVGRHAGHFAPLDVLVQALEALVAGDLGAGGAEQAHRSPPITARSLRRASCSVLYSAPRVVSRRSASTSIGTPLRASAVNTSRWWRVSEVCIASRTARS